MSLRSKIKELKRPGQNNKGQIIVEYVLLMVVGVAMAALITSIMVSRNPEDPGFVVRKWRDMLEMIGSDFADDQTPEE